MYTNTGFINEPRHEMPNNVVCATNKGSDQPAHKSSLVRAFASRFNFMSVKLLYEQLFYFLSLKGGGTRLSESTLSKGSIVTRSVVGCLTRNRGAAGTILTGVTV